MGGWVSQFGLPEHPGKSNPDQHRSAMPRCGELRTSVRRQAGIAQCPKGAHLPCQCRNLASITFRDLQKRSRERSQQSKSVSKVRQLISPGAIRLKRSWTFAREEPRLCEWIGNLRRVTAIRVKTKGERSDSLICRPVNMGHLIGNCVQTPSGS